MGLDGVGSFSAYLGLSRCFTERFEPSNLPGKVVISSGGSRLVEVPHSLVKLSMICCQLFAISYLLKIRLEALSEASELISESSSCELYCYLMGSLGHTASRHYLIAGKTISARLMGDCRELAIACCCTLKSLIDEIILTIV